MHCPICNLNTKVLESRPVGVRNSVRRRRQCLNSKCAYRFTTHEKMEVPLIAVIKTDGSKEAFKSEKILRGILKATKNTKMTSLEVEKMVSQIELELLALGKPEIKSSKIGDTVIKHLARSNKVAYMRFVSVYRRLKTVASFEKELISLKKIN